MNRYVEDPDDTLKPRYDEGCELNAEYRFCHKCERRVKITDEGGQSLDREVLCEVCKVPMQKTKKVDMDEYLDTK